MTTDSLAVDIEAFRNHLAHERRASPHTVDNYLRDLKTFLDYACKYTPQIPTVGDISLPLARGWLGERAKERSTGTIARNISSLRALVKYLRRVGKLTTDPIAMLRSPKWSLPLGYRCHTVSTADW